MGSRARFATAISVGTGIVIALLAPGAAIADESAPVVVENRFTTDDGVELQTTLTSTGPVTAKPTVVEFSPYGDDSSSFDFGAEYNYLLVQIRGTGDSDGSFDALGPQSQADVVDVLEWACAQPFSNGRLGLAGFSASAIMLYNSWHTKLPCVEGAVLRSGTHELYRDLLVPGGIQNLLPAAGVLALIGAPALLQGADRLQRDPASTLDVLGGLFESGLNAGLLHPSLDQWWQQRGWRGDANDIPVLVMNGFFDVESRGAFQAFQALRDDGAHLLMAGGHDGWPTGTDGGAAEATAWFDHYLRDADNQVEQQPRVRLLMANGSREAYLDGDYVTREAADWPVPGTTWTPLHLSTEPSGTGGSLNDGTLAVASPKRNRAQSYVSLPTFPTMSDVPNAALVGASGLDALTGALPLLTDSSLAGLTGLGYTTEALRSDVDVAGPLALDLTLTTTTPGSGIWVVLSDVAPDGSSHPLTVGRLSTSYPGVDEEASLIDDHGQVVQPYGDYTNADPPSLLESRRYQVELWPVGNQFRAGHRIRVQIMGTSLASRPEIPALNIVRIGGARGAKLLVPTLPGSDLATALGE